MKTLLLIDGSSYLYRAFHAMPDLRSPQGEPTGAIYGMVNMLARLRKEVQCDYSACIFDAKGKTFRDDLYPEYKANRPSMPTDLAAQISTGDKDMAQLVTPQVTLVNTMTNETLDESGVKEKFGVPPDRIIDYLTLI